MARAWYDTPAALAERQEDHEGPELDWSFEPETDYEPGEEVAR